jgi:uncharacterized repeat protein (TIGR01451 family)
MPPADSSNDGATDTAVVGPVVVDIALTKTDSPDPVSPGAPLTYTLTTSNLGPSDGFMSVFLYEDMPAGVTFVSSVPGPPACTFSGGLLLCDLGPLPAGGSTQVIVNVIVDSSTSGLLVNNAAALSNDFDPDLGNNLAHETTAVGVMDGELAHGTAQLLDLAAQPGPAADEDLFRISQKPYSSYEVVVDSTSGDIGAGAGPLLERTDATGNTLQTSTPIGVGSSRSLRWLSLESTVMDSETVRVRSAQCGTDCGSDDVYRIRAYETTGSIPRFNNAGSQVTVLILQNPTNYVITGIVLFWTGQPNPTDSFPFLVDPKQTFVLDTTTVPSANGVAGAITVAHDGRYGDLSGKAVAVEPSTGFSFDSPLVARVR